METLSRRVNWCLSLCLIALLIASCTVVPKPVENNMAGLDSTVPSQYIKMNGGDNGGFLFYDEEHNGYISDGLRARYNLLIKKYRIQYKSLHLVDLMPDIGISQHIDQWGNRIWKLKREYLKALILLNGMQNDRTPADSGWDKALDALLGG